MQLPAAKQIYERLVGMDYQGSYTQVKEAVRKLKRTGEGNRKG